MMKKKDNAKKIAKEKTHPTADGNVMPTDAVTATSESSASVTSSLPDAIDSVTATAPDNAHDSTASSDDLSAFEDFTSIDNFEEITTTEPLSAVELQTVTELVSILCVTLCLFLIVEALGGHDVQQYDFNANGGDKTCYGCTHDAGAENDGFVDVLNHEIASLLLLSIKLCT